MADEWQAEFRDRGYVIFPGMAGFEKAQAARRLIDQDLATNYDLARKPEYDHISACPDIRSAKEITALLRTTPITGILDDIFGIGNIDHDHGQIAIRWAHNADHPYPPEAHIDGIPNEQNRLSGSRINNFTALVGIFLSDVTEEFAGNFTVWPGSHLILERYFRKRGPDAMAEGLPEISLGEPIQLLCSAGDILLCHYQLAHTAAVNTSSNDRYAVYFRIWFNDIDKRRWQLLTNIWEGWCLPEV